MVSSLTVASYVSGWHDRSPCEPCVESTTPGHEERHPGHVPNN